MKKIYIAGPDVFSPDSVKIGKEYSEICESAGFQGIYPVDGSNRKISGKKIAKDNFKLIDECDYVVANCNPFRGIEMDCGTACEIGYALAKNKKVYCYLSDITPMFDIYGEKDDEGYLFENFGYPINVMIAASCNIIKGTFKEAIARVCFDEFQKE